MEKENKNINLADLTDHAEDLNHENNNKDILKSDFTTNQVDPTEDNQTQNNAHTSNERSSLVKTKELESKFIKVFESPRTVLNGRKVVHHQQLQANNKQIGASAMQLSWGSSNPS